MRCPNAHPIHPSKTKHTQAHIQAHQSTHASTPKHTHTTLTAVSSMKMALSGSDLDIFSWFSFNPISMAGACTQTKQTHIKHTQGAHTRKVAAAVRGLASSTRAQKRWRQQQNTHGAECPCAGQVCAGLFAALLLHACSRNFSIVHGATKGFVSYGGFTHVGFPSHTPSV